MTDTWKKTCPLARVEEYLWKRLSAYPDYDWRKGEGPVPGSLHEYYEQGWELVHEIQQQLFAGGATFFVGWPFTIGDDNHRKSPLYIAPCAEPDCSESVDAVVSGVLYCFRHGYKAFHGHEYVPPTLEESRRSAALTRAMAHIRDEHPPDQTPFGTFLLMDKPYLERLVELAREEYDQLCKDKPQ